MPDPIDPRSSRARFSRVPPADPTLYDEDAPLFDSDTFSVLPAPPDQSTSDPFSDYAPAAIRGLSALVPGGPWGAAAGGVGEIAAEALEGDLKPWQIAAQTGLGFVPFGRTRGLLKTGAKAATMGAAGGGATQLAEEIGDEEAGVNLDRIMSAAKRGGLVGGVVGAGTYGLLRRFLGGGETATAGGGGRLRRAPGERAEFDVEGTVRAPRPRAGEIPAPVASHVPYRSATAPIKHRGGIRGDVEEGLLTDVAVESPVEAARRLGVESPTPASRMSQGDSPTVRNPLAAATPEIPAPVPSHAVSTPEPSPQTPLGKLFRVSAPEFRDITTARERLVDKTGGLPIPAGMRDQLDRMGLEYRRTRDAYEALQATPNADPREIQRLHQATRELGSRLSGMEREAVRAAKTQVPEVRGGGPEAAAPSGREGHFTLPVTKRTDREYDAIRRMLGVEESPLAVAERRTQDVGSPTGVERRNPIPPEFRAVGDEAGFVTPELATTMGTGVLGAGLGAWQADPEDRLRDTVLGGLLGAGIPTLARSNPNALRKLEQWRAGAMLSGGAQVKNILGNLGSVGYESARRALAGDTTTARNLLSEFFSPRTVERARQAFTDPSTDFTRGTSPRGGPLEIFGRTMGSTDAATRGAMEAAGLTAEEARRAVLTADPTTQEGRMFLSYHNASPLARFFIPFARTNVNQLERFAETIKDAPQVLGGGPSGRDALARLLLAGGAGAAGYELGQEYPNASPFLTAAAGPAGVPFLMGATAGRLTDEGQESGDVLRGIMREVGRNMPLATDYSMDPARWLASYVPNFLRVLNPDVEERDTRGSVFGPSLRKIPFLSETLPIR